MMNMLHFKRTYIIFAIACVLIYYSYPTSDHGPPNEMVSGGRAGSQAGSDGQELHILTVATDPDINLCKTLYSGAVLDYPPPVIIAWKQNVDKEEGVYYVGGGSHLLKVSKVLEWLENLPPERDNELVMMMDGYDIWFQLPKKLFIERYHRINAHANRRIRKRMGRAASIEKIQQKILFVTGKRCYPNEVHTVSCWPIPPSPLYKDMWGGNTDHTVGSYPNIWTATRQRFLNSGVIVGPAKDMRALFARAAQKIKDLGEEPEDDDNGSRASERVYKHSDQSVFNMIFGEQEYQREVMRIRHMSWLWNPILKLEQLFGKDLSDTTATLEGNPIGNILDPPWSHAEIAHLPGRSLEYGIGLDYWSQLSFQTANSERNAAWLNFSEPLDPQVKHRGRWDCKPHLEYNLPADLLAQDPPFSMLKDGLAMISTRRKRDVDADADGDAGDQSSSQKSDLEAADSPDDEKRVADDQNQSSDDQDKPSSSSSTTQQKEEETNQKAPIDISELISRPWASLPLYTNICAGTIPALVHINGDKGMRERNWTNMWFQPYADQLSMVLQPREALSPVKGANEKRMLQPWEAFADTGEVVDFSKHKCGNWDFS